MAVPEWWASFDIYREANGVKVGASGKFSRDEVAEMREMIEEAKLHDGE